MPASECMLRMSGQNRRMEGIVIMIMLLQTASFISMSTKTRSTSHWGMTLQSWNKSLVSLLTMSVLYTSASHDQILAPH